MTAPHEERSAEEHAVDQHVRRHDSQFVLHQAPDVQQSRLQGATPTAVDAARSATTVTLTYREQDVLTLLGQRLTDAEIAAQLSISPRTVSSHVSSLLVKLGAGNRREATAIAVRRGLL